MKAEYERIQVIDSHTAGEPTRVVVGGFPDLGAGSISDRLDRFKTRFDYLRTAILCEPRGHDAIVGAVLIEPVNSSSRAGVIFFNNTGYLKMCGHGTIGLIRTLEYLGRIKPGIHSIETTVGIVTARLSQNGEVTVENVPSYRYQKNVEVGAGEFGVVRGDIAWGGNWFFLIEDHDFDIGLARLDELTRFTSLVKDSLAESGITGKDGAEIDHVELFSPTPGADSKNFVLCPGGEYDRSPCGTGTSAKLACLVADGKLAAGEVWRQESIIGSHFEGTVRLDGDDIIPSITGAAFITAEIDLIMDDHDPFRRGIGY